MDGRSWEVLIGFMLASATFVVVLWLAKKAADKLE